MGNREEAAPQPPQRFPFDPEGQGAGARQLLLRKAKRLSGPIGKVTYARPILSYLSKKGEQFVLPFCTLI